MKLLEKHGFTLVELSIVLVIIGLLIGGILVAQSMIETAKVQNFVRTVQQFDAAILNFKTKFNSLPGDSALFGGDGDSHVSEAENAHFWYDLQKSGFATNDKTYSNALVVLDINSANPSSPKVPISKDAGVRISQWNIDHTYVFVSPSGSDWDGTVVATPAFALAADAKMDDGKPMYGYVLATHNSAYEGDDCIVDSDNYKLANKTIECYIEARIFHMAGDTLDAPN